LDGRYLYYASDQTGTYQIWKVPVDGSAVARQVTIDGGFRPMETPGGKWLYYCKREPQSGVFRMPLASGAEEQVMAVPASAWGSWAVSATGLYYTEHGKISRILFRPYDSSDNREMYVFRNAPVHYDGALDVSANDEHIIFAQLDRAISDIYQIEINSRN
jgi:Tol biopolymer transport system component